MIFNGNSILTRVNDYTIFPGEEDEDTSWVSVRSLVPHLSEERMAMVLDNFLKYRFRSRHRFCGFCGSETGFNKEENAYTCSECNESYYPQVFPAVIVSVIKDDKILLANNSNFPKDLYSVIAGFVDQNETLEECVKREVFEETGLRVKNVKYYGSQFWGFTTSLMIGFTAEYESGDIEVDGKEIVHAKWFKKDELPLIPSKISMARKLIDDFTGE